MQYKYLGHRNKERYYIKIEKNPVFSSHPGKCQIKGKLFALVYKIPSFYFYYQNKMAVWYIFFLLNKNLKRGWLCQLDRSKAFFCGYCKQNLINLRFYYRSKSFKIVNAFTLFKTPCNLTSFISLGITINILLIDLKAYFVVKTC